MRDYLTPVKMAASKRREMTNAGKDVENRESLYTVGGVGKLYNQYRKEHGRSSENWKQNYHMMWQFCFWDKEMRRDSKIISAPPIVALFPIAKTWKHEMPTDVWIDKEIMRFICIYIYVYIFPGGSAGKEPACQCRRAKRCRFDPWVRKIPWRRARQPTPVFFPGKLHGQRSLAGYSRWGCKSWTCLSAGAHTHTSTSI